MQNSIQSGKVLEAIAPSGGVVSGGVYKIGQLLLVAIAAAAAGDTFEGETAGVFLLTKKTSDTFTAYCLVYWDNTAKNFTTTATSNLLAGCAITAASSSDTLAYIRLNGEARADEAGS